MKSEGFISSQSNCEKKNEKKKVFNRPLLISATVNTPFWSCPHHWMPILQVMPGASQLPTQPCIRPWVDCSVHVNVVHSSSRWQLNSWAGPPSCWGPPFVWADRRRSEERRMGTLQVCSGFWALWKDLSRPFRSDGSFPCFFFFCISVWIISPSIFLICAHTTDTFKMLYLV